MGGSSSDALSAAAISGASTFAFEQIGKTFNGSEGSWNETGGAAHIAAHAVTGGIIADLQGGKFGHGFWSAGLTKAINVNEIIGTSQETGMDAVRIATAAVIGGTISDLTGGKFANGARTAAFAQAYNGEGEARRKAKLQRLSNKSGVRLGIHSNVKSESDFTDGHAWISVTDTEGNVTNYGLWPDEHPATVNNGTGSDVRVGLENGAVSVASKYFDLTVDQNTKLNTFLSTSAEWGYTYTCADWARDAVNYSTGQRIDVDDWMGFETPRELSRSLGK